MYYYSWKASSPQLAAAEEYVLVGVTTPSDLQQTGPWVSDSNILEGCPSLVTLDLHKHCVLFDNKQRPSQKVTLASLITHRVCTHPEYLQSHSI